MKHYIWIGFLIALTLFLGTLLYGGETHLMAQDGAKASDALQTQPAEATWDEGEPPAPPRMGEPEGKRNPAERESNRGLRPSRKGFGSNSPRRPQEDGDRPREDGDRPEPNRPPMGPPEGRPFPPEGSQPYNPKGDINHRMEPFDQEHPRHGPFQDWEELERVDPEFFALLKLDAELERTTRQLTMRYRQTRSAQIKEELGKQLGETVTKHFDVRQQRRAMELNRLEKELSRLKELYEKRNNMKDTIIEKRVQELKGEEESLF